MTTLCRHAKALLLAACTTLSGCGMGKLVDCYGWDAGFAGLVAYAAIGTILFIVVWPAKAHGYKS